jgi:hypothetical protein
MADNPLKGIPPAASPPMPPAETKPAPSASLTAQAGNFAPARVGLEGASATAVPGELVEEEVL